MGRLREDSRDMKGKKMKLMFIFLVLIFQTKSSVAASSSFQRSKHFVLVHGASHGAWSWYKLAALLRSSGHNVTAPDLAASGINPKQFYDVKTISDYLQPLMGFMGSLPPHERVILVAHSFGGLAISQAMEMLPDKIAAAVFVTAWMPGPHFPVSTLMKEDPKRNQRPLLDNRYIYSNGPDKPPTAFEFGPKALTENVYQRCPTEDLTLATMLVRPMYLYSEEEMKKVTLTRSKYGSVRRVFIIAEEDKQLKKGFQEWMIKKNPPHQVQEIKGADHMAMLSKPAELFLHLLSIAQSYD